MRIWSVHPKYLDAKGLVALWRETLLAKNVLEGKTKGYKNHPQLIRFKESKNPLACINAYLNFVWQEAEDRGYHFNSSKFDTQKNDCFLEVESGQLAFEREHLLKKLRQRDLEKHNIYSKLEHWETHPIFKEIKGDIASWERI